MRGWGDARRAGRNGAETASWQLASAVFKGEEDGRGRQRHVAGLVISGFLLHSD